MKNFSNFNIGIEILLFYDIIYWQLRAIEEHGVELRRQQRDEMKQRVEEWNAQRRANGEEVIEGSDYSAIYQQVSISSTFYVRIFRIYVVFLVTFWLCHKKLYKNSHV